MTCYCESETCHPEADCPNSVTVVASPTGPGYWSTPAGPVCVHCAGPVPSEYLTWNADEEDTHRDENQDRISVYIKGYGEYRTTPAGLDRSIATYLPASPGMLREQAEERAGHPFTGVYDISTFLIVLADFDDAAV